MQHKLIGDRRGATRLEASIMIGLVLALSIPVAVAIGLWTVSQWDTIQACADANYGEACAVASNAR